MKALIKNGETFYCHCWMFSFSRSTSMIQFSCKIYKFKFWKLSSWQCYDLYMVILLIWLIRTKSITLLWSILLIMINQSIGPTSVPRSDPQKISIYKQRFLVSMGSWGYTWLFFCNESAYIVNNWKKAYLWSTISVTQFFVEIY